MNRDLLQTIEERMPTFSKGQKRIAKYILEEYEKAAYMTASKLGALVDVSESTVVRFAIELGFSGYPELQHALRDLVRTNLTSVQRMEVSNTLLGEGSVLEKVLGSDAEKIKQTLEQMDAAAFDRAIDTIVRARRIYVIGVRSAAMLAGFLSYHMQMIFGEVKLVQTTSRSELFEQILDIGEGDVLIAISFPRYSKRVIDAVEYACEAGASVISLTDSESSPIAKGATHVLTAQSDMASFVDSLVAPLSIVNAIVVATARKKENEVAKRLRRLEAIWDEYEVYDKHKR